MDVIEARTDRTLDPNTQWKLINWTKSEDEGEIFRKVTIQKVGKEDNNTTVHNNTLDIWIMRGEKTMGVLDNNTFHVWSEHDINSIDWNRGLFR